jgi:hypothetical protein
MKIKPGERLLLILFLCLMALCMLGGLKDTIDTYQRTHVVE